MAIDFIVPFDPETESTEILSQRIIRSLVVRRLQRRKPVVIGIFGDSGEGKSYTAVALQKIILEDILGVSLAKHLHDINVYTPLQYPEKLDKILYNKELKKVNIICMHEAREIVKAKKWHSFLNQAISDVNAMSRAVKRLCIMVVSQFIRDISTDIRYTINYYIKIWRPMGGTGRARLYWYVMYKDDRDLEKPKLKKRKITGFIKTPNGRYRKIVPKYLEVKLKDKDLLKEFDKKDFESKSGIIKGKLEALLKDMRQELDVKNNKIKTMVNWYTSNPDNMLLIGKRGKRGYKLRPEVREMHDLTKTELKDFNDLLQEKLKIMGYIDSDETKT